MITWDDFNTTNSTNKKTAFENMCRIFFNYYFFNNTAILKQKHNNAGIEVEPIEHNGKKISFQSKYFESGNIYSQIKHSITKAIEYYKNKIDEIYIFSNKDLDPNSNSYKEILDLLKPYNIKLTRFCNQSILDTIETNNYDTIKHLFFGKHNLSKKWFDDNLKISLQDLEPRYTSGFNVDTEIQKFFEIKYMTDDVFNILIEHIKKIKESLKYIRQNSVIDSVKTKINKLEIPTKENFANIFNWYNLFEVELSKLLKLQKEYNEKLYKTDDAKIRNELFEIISDINKTIKAVENLNFKNNNLFNSYNSNVLFIEGPAGIGKSHLLGYEAEKHGNNFNRTILLLGHKIMSDNSPLEQLTEQLNIKIGIDNLFNILEGLGEIDNSNTVIMIDALNESVHNTVWKNYLNTLVCKIMNYKHIKLITTIRSTYVEQIFSDPIKTKILNNEIVKIKHIGFEGIIDEAIKKFFEYYKIPINTLSYLGYSFTNPLFLKIYCKANSNKHETIGSISIDKIFNEYIDEEEKKIKEKLEIDDTYPYCRKILENLAKYLYTQEKNSITTEELYEINNMVPNYERIIPQILKSKLLITYFYENIENIIFGYERICDFYIAKHIMNEHASLEKLREDITNNLLQTNQYKRLNRYNAIGIFSALSILISEKYNEEILLLVNTLDIVDYEKNQIVKDYINNLMFRNDKQIDKEKILSVLQRNITNKSLLESFYEILITLSGRKNNPFNALYLHEILKKHNLSKRDSLWTIFINNYNEEYQLFHIVNYFENNLFNGDYDTKKLYAILLIWVLTSSNRTLRDKTSRCLTNIFKNDFTLMMETLEMFYDVNDPYVVQRLYGVIYGAVLKSDINIKKTSELSSMIYDYVFKSENVYPDILLRDYALNIIEYAYYLKCDLSFDIKKCRPPYNSKSIPQVDITIEEYFKFDGKSFTGANAIKSSITPSGNGLYGDFGRYVFESALSYFKDVDIHNLYLYALDFIKNNLGYTNELFSEYDRNIQYMGGADRHNTTKIERIGKKYEWIAFYHILALVSDSYELSNKLSNEIPDKYSGTWNPYVRDFDPTLDLNNSSKIYNLDIELNQPIYNNWTNDDNWVNNQKDVIDFKQIIFTKDNNNDEWICLHTHLKEQSSDDYENDYKEVWRMTNAYIIKSECYTSFIKKLKNNSLYGRWFPESTDRYNIFSREYCWSPAYKDEYKSETFDVEVKTNKTITKTENIPDFDIKKFINDNIVSFKEKTRNYKIPVYEKIGEVKPLWNSYLWEEEYDAAKDETISISFPAQDLINKLNLIQKENGIFYNNDEMVVADFSYIKGTTKGLYIKKSYLDKFLSENNYMIFWVCVGEKNDIKKNGFSTDVGESVFKDFSSLVYIENNKIQCKDFFGNR